MSKYEKDAIKQIHEWKNPKLSIFDRAMELINYPFEKALELTSEIPGADNLKEVVYKSVQGVLEILNDFAQKSVRTEAIFKEFREGNLDVYEHKDIYNIDLQKVDHIVGYLGAKYKSLALAEGSATGLAGIVGIPIDISSLLTLNLRAIGEYATYYGFDINTQHERFFAMNILGYASSSKDSTKYVVLSQLEKIAVDVARNKSWSTLQQSIIVRVIKNISESIGIRLTKAKLAQVIPVLGALVGGGFNAYYTNKVCEAAYYLYRERFLATKYEKPEVIEINTNWENNFDIEYLSGDERKELK